MLKNKNLNETFVGDKDKQLQTILKILWALKEDDKFYFFSYGKDIIERYINEAEKSDKEMIEHLKLLVNNKNALIGTIDK